MPSTERVLASAAELVGEFSRYSDVALSQPVVVTREGVPRNVLISYAEYERLIGRDIQAFRAADTPDEFLDDLTRLAVASH
jgi:prevent-host-death family protein